MTTLPSIQTARIVLSLLCLCWLAGAESGKRLWVLEEPDRIAEFDPNTFALRSSHRVPAEVFQSPQDLQINGKGQMLFLAATQREPDGLVHESSSGRMWFWDGSSAKFLNRSITNTRVPSGGNVVVTTAKPRCFLSANGTHLFWFVNRFKTLQTSDMGQDISVHTTFHGWQTGLSEEQPEDIATYNFAPCICGTAVCSETCGEASYSLPDTGIDDHFIITNWVPGQIQSEYQASFLYRKSARGWTQTKLPSAVEQVLDSSWDGGGLVLIEAIADGGCCGWVNASDDQTLLTKNGKSIVLFDEFQRYQNQDYDVSFFTAKAKLSPHSILAALTITATSEPGKQIRLSDSGKANAAELARIQQALRELPAVEVLRLGDPPKRTAMIPRARLVGWVSDEEILVVENSLLVSYDLTNGRRKKSEIKVARESHAFLR